jgi:hypothetical protein
MLTKKIGCVRIIFADEKGKQVTMSTKAVQTEGLKLLESVNLIQYVER